MNSFSRLYDVIDQTSEQDPNVAETKDNWIKQGKIEFVNVSLRYNPEREVILKNLNIKILPGEKIGVVGRSGSGKSTIIQALFRIREIEKLP
jgi:ABC-type multidrug transport system fused ATPase/permease subunit